MIDYNNNIWFWGEKLNISRNEYNYINTTYGIIALTFKEMYEEMHTNFLYKEKSVMYRARISDIQAQLKGMLSLLEVQQQISEESVDNILRRIQEHVTRQFDNWGYEL